MSEAGRIDVNCLPAADRVDIEFLPANGVAGRISLNSAQLLELIQKLGSLHKHLFVGKDIPRLEGQTIEAVFNTKWFVFPEMIGEAAALSFYHTSFGPLGFLIPVEQLPKFMRPLQRLVEAKAREDLGRKSH